MEQFYRKEIIRPFLRQIWEFSKLDQNDQQSGYSHQICQDIHEFIIRTDPEVFIEPDSVTFFRALQKLYLEKNKSIFELELIFAVTKLSNINIKEATDIVNEITNSPLQGDVSIIKEQYHLILRQFKYKLVAQLIAKLGNAIKERNITEVTKQLDEFYLDKFSNLQIEDNYINLKDLVVEYLATIDNKSNQLGEPTGIKGLDEIIGGLISNNFIVVAARPSIGKSAFAINLISRIFKDNSLIDKKEEKKTVLFISLEMSCKELMWRFIANVSSINSTRIQKKEITKDEMTIIQYDTDQIWKKSSVILNKLTAVSIEDIDQIIRQVKQRYNLKVIIIDYIQLISMLVGNRGNREQEVAKISRRLKLIAMKHKVCVIGLSQLSRRIELRENKEPVLSDLRESGAIEQDADIIIFLYQQENQKFKKNTDIPELYEAQIIQQKATEKNIVHVKIGKNRNGRIGYLKFYFDKKFQQFREL